MSVNEPVVLGRILVADDEETFLHSTADLLRREGYFCDTAPDAAIAADLLARNSYDLLIADIKMPGNPKLELIRKMPAIAAGMPAILVTGYPSVESAVNALQLPVAAYLVKPFDILELLGHVRTAIARYRLLVNVQRVQGRLNRWKEDLDKTEQLMRRAQGGVGPIPIDTFLDLTIDNIVASLADLRSLVDSIQKQTGDTGVCHLLACPQRAAFLRSTRDVIDVLQKTKTAFKSRELGELREKLELLVKDVE